MYTLYINHVTYALQLPVGSDSEVVILPHYGNSQHEKQHIALIAMYVNIYTLHAAEKRWVTTNNRHSVAVVPACSRKNTAGSIQVTNTAVSPLLLAMTPCGTEGTERGRERKEC